MVVQTDDRAQLAINIIIRAWNSQNPHLHVPETLAEEIERRNS